MRKRVLITGGTGFLGRRLGSALKDQYDDYLGRRNNKQNMVAERITGCLVIPLDIVSQDSFRDAVIEAKPDIVIHAAATQFVDLSEKYSLECVDVNVLGSENVARACMDRGIATVIGIWTKVAAPPVCNAYAMTNALMERMFFSLNGKSDPKLSCVRVGNLAWSTGSVLPIRKRINHQTRKGLNFARESKAAKGLPHPPRAQANKADWIVSPRIVTQRYLF